MNKDSKKKKTHIKPSIEVYNVEPKAILATSGNSSDVGGEGLYFD